MNYLLNFLFLFCALLHCPYLLSAQNSYAQTNFGPPLTIPLVLAGTFGELRSNHFHAGIDIKTKSKEGFLGGSTLTTDFFIPTYQACRAQGYSREFCVQTPEGDSPDSCMCADGRRGKYLVGYRGECVCDDFNQYQLSY